MSLIIFVSTPYTPDLGRDCFRWPKSMSPSSFLVKSWTTCSAFFAVSCGPVIEFSLKECQRRWYALLVGLVHKNYPAHSWRLFPLQPKDVNTQGDPESLLLKMPSAWAWVPEWLCRVKLPHTFCPNERQINFLWAIMHFGVYCNS